MKAQEFYDKNLENYNLLNKIDPMTAKQAMQMMEEYHQAKLKLLGIADVSGLACKCGNQIFTHRHSNWIECTACNKIQVLQA